MTEPILYPTILRRIGVIVYDSLLIMAVSIFYGVVYIAISKLLFNITTDRPSGLLFQLGWLCTLISFYLYFWRKGGQTTGMRAWRIQIQHQAGGCPSIKQCLIRLITAPLGWLLLVTALFHPKKQWLHDQLSQTELILLPKTSS